MNKLNLADPNGKLKPAQVRIAAVTEGYMADSVLFDVTGQSSDRRTYSNLAPQDAREVAVALLRAADEAEGREYVDLAVKLAQAERRARLAESRLARVI